jgi:hypothetical protein
MKLTRTLALTTGLALLLAACSKEPEETAGPPENANPLLAFAPADTIYAFANMEPVPSEITDAYTQRFQPVLDVLSGRVERFQADYDGGAYEGDLQARFAKAVLDELGGELSTESLAKIGISLQSHRAAYAMGVFPVIRLELADAQALRDAIARVSDEMGYQIPEKTLDGTAYWSITEAGEPVGAYISIFDGQLAFSLFPVSAEDTMLPALLGHELPAESLADNNALAIMNSQKGYTAYGSGFVDLQGLADEMLDPSSMTNVHLGSHMDYDPATLSAACASEFRSLAAKAPRMTIGTTSLGTDEIAMRYELEMEDSMATALADLVPDIPAAEEGDNLFAASLALKVGKFRSFMLEKASAIVASPYQCEQLQELNREAEKLVTQLNVPMPPMVNNLLGLRLRLDDVDPDGDYQKSKGLLVLHVDQPEMFTGMATMMVPGLEELDLASQSDPVRIPQEVLRFNDLVVHALSGDQAIGLSLGEDYAANLADFLDAEPGPEGVFLSVSYDMARQLELQGVISKNLAMDLDHHDSDHGDIAEALKASYAAMLDRSRTEMRFTPDGLTIDSHISFK